MKAVLCSINSFREPNFRSNNFLLSQWLKPANWSTPQGLLSLWFLTLGLSTQQSCWAYDFWRARCELNNIVESMVSHSLILAYFCFKQKTQSLSIRFEKMFFLNLNLIQSSFSQSIENGILVMKFVSVFHILHQFFILCLRKKQGKA